MLLGSIERLKTGYYSALQDEQDEDIDRIESIADQHVP